MLFNSLDFFFLLFLFWFAMGNPEQAAKFISNRQNYNRNSKCIDLVGMNQEKAR